MHKKYMTIANELAKEAFLKNEIPIGAVIVHDDMIIAKSRNDREEKKSTFGHAEISAISQASAKIGSWKLEDCTMYVTVEPCLMCYGAILQSRIKKVYIGSKQDPIKKSSFRKYISDPEIEINESTINDVSINLMKDFFKEIIREKK